MTFRADLAHHVVVKALPATVSEHRTFRIATFQRVRLHRNLQGNIASAKWPRFILLTHGLSHNGYGNLDFAGRTQPVGRGNRRNFPSPEGNEYEDEDENETIIVLVPVSYTHLTLPTKA